MVSRSVSTRREQFSSDAASPDPRTAARGPSWGFVAVGLAIGLACGHLGGVSSIRSQVHELREELTRVRRAADRLVAEEPGVWRTNTLLAGLAEQRQGLDGTRAVIADLRELRDDLRRERRRTDDARAALAELAVLYDTVGTRLGEAGELAHTAGVLVETGRAEVERSDHTVAELADRAHTLFAARQTVERVDELTTALSDAAPAVDAAAATLAGVVRLGDRSREAAAGLASAETALSQLTALRAMVSDAGRDFGPVWERFAGFVRLRDAVLADAGRTDHAVRTFVEREVPPVRTVLVAPRPAL